MLNVLSVCPLNETAFGWVIFVPFFLLNSIIDLNPQIISKSQDTSRSHNLRNSSNHEYIRKISAKTLTDKSMIETSMRNRQ